MHMASLNPSSPLIVDKKSMDALDAGEDMNSVTVATGRGAAHKGQDIGTASTTTAGVTRTKPPGPLGQFQTCLVKPLARFLTMPYLHAQRILQFSRTVHVFHMQSTYIARQAIHLVILLNDMVDVYEGPDEEQYQERIDLGDELIELFDAMQEWGAKSDEGLEVDYDQGLLKINQQYAQFFKERFYFHNVRNSSDDLIYSKVVAYDRKTIDFRKWQYLRATSVDLNESTIGAESESGTESKPAGNSKKDDDSFSEGMDWVADVPPPSSSPAGAASSLFYRMGMDDYSDYPPEMSPLTFLDDSSASELALKLSPDTPEFRSMIQDLLQGNRTLEIPDDICAAFNATPDGPKYTCSLFKENKQRCLKSFNRFDRLKHHLQGHLGITPYRCMESPKPTAGLKCERLFSSVAARDSHVRNKGGPVMRDCGIMVLPRNLARHRTTCSTCSSLQPSHSTPS